jgi:hypothetical protein
MGTVTYNTWMVVLPKGKRQQRTIGWEGQSPEEVWDLALLWPTPAEVESAKRKGAYLTRATVTYEQPEPPPCEPPE